jgi:glycosyltransferase involved in cell wall biosynthesis
MVNIAKETVARGKNIKFILAGEGPDMDMIAEMIRGYGIGDRFNLAGFINDTAGFYESLDCI